MYIYLQILEFYKDYVWCTHNLFHNIKTLVTHPNYHFSVLKIKIIIIVVKYLTYMGRLKYRQIK